MSCAEWLGRAGVDPWSMPGHPRAAPALAGSFRVLGQMGRLVGHPRLHGQRRQHRLQFVPVLGSPQAERPPASRRGSQHPRTDQVALFSQFAGSIRFAGRKVCYLGFAGNGYGAPSGTPSRSLDRTVEGRWDGARAPPPDPSAGSPRRPMALTGGGRCGKRRAPSFGRIRTTASAGVTVRGPAWRRTRTGSRR
jgi:hypothetical protein